MDDPVATARGSDTWEPGDRVRDQDKFTPEHSYFRGFNLRKIIEQRRSTKRKFAWIGRACSRDQIDDWRDVMASIKAKARVAGALYVSASLIGLIRLLIIPSKLFVKGNATATADNIAAHESFFRLGIFTYLVAATLFIFVTLALYRLLRDVNRELAVLMVILGSLMVVPLFFADSVNDAGALMFARDTDFLSVFNKPQRDAFVMLFIRLHDNLTWANAFFWGIWLFPLAVLVYQSGFLPRLIGVWLFIAGMAWVGFSFTRIAAPEYDWVVDKVFNVASFGEILFMFWLLIRGANVKKQISAAATD